MTDEQDPSSLPSNVRKLSDRRWKFERTNYNPNTIYGQTRDDKGHSNWIRTRMQPSDYDALTSLLAGDTPHPYHNVSEFVRDAVIHRMVYIAQRYDQWTAEFDNFLEAHNLAVELGKRRRYREWIEQMIVEVDSIADDFSRREQVPEAIEQLLAIRDQITDRDIPSRDYIHRYITSKLTDLRKQLKKKP